MMMIIIVLLILFLFANVFSGDDEEIPYRQFIVNERNTFVPAQFTTVIDSAKVNPDYIDDMMSKQFTDTTSYDSLYSNDDPVFDAYEMGDTAVVLSRKDMAFYIKDASLVKYQQSEIDARKKLQTEFIRSAIVAEDLYRTTLTDANKYSSQIYKQYKSEKRSKEIWRMTFVILGSFVTGYVIHEAID
jgi:hypothetical protein